MSLSASESNLLRLSQAKKTDIESFKEGLYLEKASGLSIDELRLQACADRLQLAESFLGAADRLMRSRPPMLRVAVGRYYYAMYHAMRAVVYFQTPGDDHEQHSILPGRAPGDFPNVDYWKNELKNARLRRNQADYDPYPAADQGFRDLATALRRQAHALLTEARSYLHLKGCACL